MATSPTPSPSAAQARGLAGKYLTFRLGHESYGVSVLKVREIIRMVEITPVPQMPAYVRGVINLRGRVIPVIDLRMKFNLGNAEIGERTCTVVVQVTTPQGGRSFTGLIVDAVEEVTGIGPADIEPTPDFGTKLQTDHILGMAKIRGVVKALLDIDRVVSAEAIDLAARNQPSSGG